VTRANAMFAEPRERDLLADEATAERAAPEIEAVPPPPLPSGAELLIGEIGEALRGARPAYDALIAARATGDMVAIRSAAIRLVAELNCDPKALARRLSLMVKP
jgi:hypothetical protein